MACEVGNPKEPTQDGVFAHIESNRYGDPHVVTEEETRNEDEGELWKSKAHPGIGPITKSEHKRAHNLQVGSAIQNCNDACAPAPSQLARGVEGTNGSSPQEDVDVAHHNGGIRNIIKMRLGKDPLQNVRSRTGRAVAEYDRLMAFIDEVSHSIECPDPDSDPNWALVSRVCAVSKHLFPSVHSDSLNQCVLEEALAICIIERVARAHADGVYTWCGTAWSKVDGHHFVTMSMKTEWKKCTDCSAGFFFSMHGKGVSRSWPDIELFLKGQVSQYRGNAQALLNLRGETRRVSAQHKERTYGVSSSVKFCNAAEWPL